jgi:hypothetical protein
MARAMGRAPCIDLVAAKSVRMTIREELLVLWIWLFSSDHERQS